jgi:hypothetical protein
VHHEWYSLFGKANKKCCFKLQNPDSNQLHKLIGCSKQTKNNVVVVSILFFSPRLKFVYLGKNKAIVIKL